MKFTKIFTAVLLITFLFSACGIDGNNKTAADAEKNGRLTIVTSFYPMYLFTLNITRDVKGIEVINMTSPQAGCLHDYQLSPADMKTLESADIFIANGAGLESFLDKAKSQMNNLKIIEASKGLKLLKEEGTPGNANTVYNPHVWVSISGAIGEVSNIGADLAVLDPGNAQKYKANTTAYVNRLEVLKQKMHRELDGVKNKSIITFHEAFPYFAEEFGLKVAAVVEQQPGTQPSPRELTEIIDLIGKTGVRTLFTEPQYPSGTAQTIAGETGARIYTLDPVVTGPEKANPDEYIRIMESNLNVLKKALN